MTRRHYTKFKYENFCEIKISVRSKLGERVSHEHGKERERKYMRNRAQEKAVEEQKQEKTQHTHTYYQLEIYMYFDNINPLN